MTEAVRDTILQSLSDGTSLSAICREDGMPAWSTMHEWMERDAAFAGQVARAREAGYHKRAADAVAEAKAAADPVKGRLAFDAERWYLGKLSNAFSDKQKLEHTGKGGGPIETKGALNVSGFSEATLREIAAAGAHDS